MVRPKTAFSLPDLHEERLLVVSFCADAEGGWGGRDVQLAFGARVVV